MANATAKASIHMHKKVAATKAIGLKARNMALAPWFSLINQFILVNLQITGGTGQALSNAPFLPFAQTVSQHVP